MTGVLTINNTNDNQILLTSPSSWTGIGWNDSAAGGTEYIWVNGTHGTFAIGGGGSSVSGKKLHVDGGMTVGSGYDATAVTANSLNVQGTVTATGGNSTNWNTAYGWGNHASGGYAPASTTITTSATQGSALYIRNSSPTIYLRDTDNLSSMIHQNSNILYILRSNSNDATGWTAHDGTAGTVSGQWPLTINITNASNSFAIGSPNVSAAGNTVFHAGNSTQFTSTMNTKLAGIATSANNYALPFTNNSGNWNTAYAVSDASLRNNTIDDETLFAITDQDTTASIVNKFFNQGSGYFTKADDATAPASGVFDVAGAINVNPFGDYIPMDGETEIMFECWAKHISGSDTSGNFYAGGEFYNGSKTSYGNVHRYWGANGDVQDSDTPNPPRWRHIKGVMKGSVIRGQSQTPDAQYLRFLTLFNYNASGNTTRFCGL